MVNKPHNFNTGDLIVASKFNENFDTIYTAFNSGASTGGGGLPLAHPDTSGPDLTLPVTVANVMTANGKVSSNNVIPEQASGTNGPLQNYSSTVTELGNGTDTRIFEIGYVFTNDVRIGYMDFSRNLFPEELADPRVPDPTGVFSGSRDGVTWKVLRDNILINSTSISISPSYTYSNENMKYYKLVVNIPNYFTIDTANPLSINSINGAMYTYPPAENKVYELFNHTNNVTVNFSGGLDVVFEFPNPTVVKGYGVLKYSTSPGTYTFKGSNDGVTYTDVDVFNFNTTSLPPYKLSSHFFTNNTAYKMYKLVSGVEDTSAYQEITFYNEFTPSTYPVSPTNGMQVFDTTTEKVRIYYNGTWRDV